MVQRERVVAVALTLSFIGTAGSFAQEVPSSQQSNVRVAEKSAPFSRLYLKARDAEAAATAELIRLDRDARVSKPSLARQTTASTAARPAIAAVQLRERETRLLNRDLEVNATLDDLYANAAKSGRPGSDADYVRAALLHWNTLLRRRLMGSWHTVVPGLKDDPRCAGDLIGDQLLLKYFETLFDNPASLAKTREAVAALAALARQSACLGEQQSFLLASNFYWSFQELKTFLKYNGLERIVPAVAQAGAAPLLLFYDVDFFFSTTSRSIEACGHRWDAGSLRIAMISWKDRSRIGFLRRGRACGCTVAELVS